jgi:hypothetical protein
LTIFAPDLGPILLFDMRVVVFLVGAAAGELDGMILTVVEDAGIDELGAVVGVDAKEWKGEGLAHFRQRGAHGALALADGGTGLVPAGVDVDENERLQKLAVRPVSGVRDKVDFGEARRGYVPVFSADGDVVFEESPGFRAAVEAVPDLAFAGLQAAVRRPGTHLPQLPLDGGREGEVPPDPRQP